MRMLLTVELDTQLTNAAIKDKLLPELMRHAMERLQPEAAYSGARNGKRTGFIVFDLADPSDMPPLIEPFFQELGTHVELTPVMSADDIMAGLEKYGHGPH